MQNQIFISYRHESPKHARIVRRLGEALRQAKLKVALDQFYLEENSGGPDEGWPKWCEDCANESACVLIIASEGWFAAYDKTAQPLTGLGAASEADIFRQNIYDDQGINSRIRLAYLNDISSEKVPTRLRPWHQFRPFDNDEQLNDLVRWTAGRLGIQDFELPTVRWPETVEFSPDLADRKDEWPDIIDLLAGQSRKRIFLIEGASGLGKSALIKETISYAKKIDIPLVKIDFKDSTLDIEGILGLFELDLDKKLLPNFCRSGANKVHQLRKDLRTLRQPALLIFDTYESIAENPTIADWLSQQILNEVETSLGLCVILAGQKIPSYSNSGWSDLAKPFQLEPIKEIKHWQSWIERKYPGFQDKGVHLPTVLMLAEGVPGVVANSCDIIAKSEN